MSQRGEQCTFCDLIRGSAEVSICHEDADAIAFMDIQPVNAGHVLVIPREHYENLLDVPQELGVHLFHVTMRLANAVSHVTGCTDMNIVVNSGSAAGQDEPHYHVHIIPRRHDDGFDIPLPFNGSAMPDRTMLDAVAAQIIAAMRDPMRVAGREGHEGGAGADARAGAASSSSPGGRKSAVGRRADQDVAVPFLGDEGTPRLDPEASGAPESSPRQHGSPYEGAHGELRYSEPADLER